MYSTTSELTKQVCKTIGAEFGVQFVKTMARGGKVYVSGTLGKPEEWAWLEAKCREAGYVYRGRKN